MHVTKDKVEYIVNKAFPGYNGKMFQVKVAESVTLHGVNWSGGSRNSWAVVSLKDDEKVGRLDNMMAPWDERNPEGTKVELTSEFVVVEHCIFCGKDLGITIYAHPNSIVKELVEPMVSTDMEKKRLHIVMSIFCGLKSFARPEYLVRYVVTEEEINECINKGLIKCHAGKRPVKGKYDWDLAGASATMAGKNMREALNKELGWLNL